MFGKKNDKRQSDVLAESVGKGEAAIKADMARSAHERSKKAKR